MTAKLSPELVEELERSGGPTLRVENPQTHRDYVLVPSEAYEQARPLFEAIIQNTRTSLSSPAPQTAAVEWNDEKNVRRCALIDKKHDASLTKEEASELESLQGELADYQRANAPRPLAILELLEEALQQRAAASASGNA